MRISRQDRVDKKIIRIFIHFFFCAVLRRHQCFQFSSPRSLKRRRWSLGKYFRFLADPARTHYVYVLDMINVDVLNRRSVVMPEGSWQKVDLKKTDTAEYTARHLHTIQTGPQVIKYTREGCRYEQTNNCLYLLNMTYANTRYEIIGGSTAICFT